MDPWQDAAGAGYQNVQALLALGSGGIRGKGLGKGTTEDRLPAGGSVPT